MRYILGIDIGTTAIKAAVIGEDGKVYGEETCEYVLTTMPTGEVEADLQLYTEAFSGAVTGAVRNSNADKKDIKCIGFSSTAETCVFLDENNEPLCKVIAWMDRIYIIKTYLTDNLFLGVSKYFRRFVFHC